jgi:hypothetical protein
MSITVWISDSQSAETWPAVCPLFLGKGMRLTDQNLIHEKMKSRLNSGIACYLSVRKFCRHLSKNIKFQIYETVVLHGCEAWSLTLREEHRLKVFENRVLSRIFGSKSHEEIGGWRIFHNEELHNSIIRMMKSRRMRLAGEEGYI